MLRIFIHYSSVGKFDSKIEIKKIRLLTTAQQKKVGMNIPKGHIPIRYQSKIVISSGLWTSGIMKKAIQQIRVPIICHDSLQQWTDKGFLYFLIRKNMGIFFSQEM